MSGPLPYTQRLRLWLLTDHGDAVIVAASSVMGAEALAGCDRVWQIVPIGDADCGVRGGVICRGKVG